MIKSRICQNVKFKFDFYKIAVLVSLRFVFRKNVKIKFGFGKFEVVAKNCETSLNQKLTPSKPTKKTSRKTKNLANCCYSLVMLMFFKKKSPYLLFWSM